jgi:[acyl-carrier-protein] S-malonyltransferase
VSAPTMPVVQNVDASISGDPAQIRRNLIAQLSSPVQWTRCVEAMIARGASVFVECGPGKVLGALIKRINRTAVPLAIGTVDAFEAALSEVSGG